MLKFMEGLPKSVLAVEAAGKVTHEDYKTTLIPKAESMMEKGPISMLYVIGKECTGFEIRALRDDGVFGLRHLRDFGRIAVVTDHAWLRFMVGMLKLFFHGDVRLYSLAELPSAKSWISITNAAPPR